MTKECFEKLKKNYGKYSSWTLWDKDTGSSMNWANDTNLLEKLKSDFVFVALNFSGTKDSAKIMAWENFHSNDSNIKKLRLALNDTKFQGCYITDIIKDFSEPKSQEVEKALKENPKFEKEQIQKFKDEITPFGKPVLLALGHNTYKILKRNNINDEYKVVYVQHYASRNNAETYKNKIKQQLEADGLW